MDTGMQLERALANFFIEVFPYIIRFLLFVISVAVLVGCIIIFKYFMDRIS